jgi:type IV pilus assembly protein PilE
MTLSIHHAHPRRARGFTLIEMMIVVAVIGILTAIAYPSYQNSVIRANRKDAMGVVQAAAQAAERFGLQNNTYVNATIPTQSPIEGNAIYNIAIVGTTTAYTITATPVAGRRNAGDGNITLTETGVRDWNGTGSWRD